MTSSSRSAGEQRWEKKKEKKKTNENTNTSITSFSVQSDSGQSVPAGKHWSESFSFCLSLFGSGQGVPQLNYQSHQSKFLICFPPFP